MHSGGSSCSSQSGPSLAALADLPDEFQAPLLGPPLRRGSLGSSRPLDRHAAGRKLPVGGSEQPRSTAQQSMVSA